MTTISPLSIASCSSSSSSSSSLNKFPNSFPRITATTRVSSIHPIHSAQRRRMVSCGVAVSSSVDVESEEDEADRIGQSKIGARVKVKAPQLKVYHIPKVAEMDIAGMEGEIKQYVAVWKGKRISANFPFKVEFFTEIEGRGRVKFLAHLREDEFEYLTQQ